MDFYNNRYAGRLLSPSSFASPSEHCHTNNLVHHKSLSTFSPRDSDHSIVSSSLPPVDTLVAALFQLHGIMSNQQVYIECKDKPEGKEHDTEYCRQLMYGAFINIFNSRVGLLQHTKNLLNFWKSRAEGSGALTPKQEDYNRFVEARNTHQAVHDAARKDFQTVFGYFAIRHPGEPYKTTNMDISKAVQEYNSKKMKEQEEAKAKKKAEEEAKKKAEEEVQKIVEEEAKDIAEVEAKRIKEAEASRTTSQHSKPGQGGTNTGSPSKKTKK